MKTDSVPVQTIYRNGSKVVALESVYQLMMNSTSIDSARLENLLADFSKALSSGLQESVATIRISDGWRSLLFAIWQPDFCTRSFSRKQDAVKTVSDSLMVLLQRNPEEVMKEYDIIAEVGVVPVANTDPSGLEVQHDVRHFPAEQF